MLNMKFCVEEPSLRHKPNFLIFAAQCNVTVERMTGPSVRKPVGPGVRLDKQVALSSLA